MERFFWFHKPSSDSDSVPTLCKHWLNSGHPWSQHDVAVLRTVSAALVDPALQKEKLWRTVVEDWVKVSQEEDYWLLLFDLDDEGQFEPSVNSREISELQVNCLKNALDPIVVIAHNAVADNDVTTLRRAIRILSCDALPSEIRSWFEQDIGNNLEEVFEQRCKNFDSEVAQRLTREKDNTKDDTENNRLACNELSERLRGEIEPELNKLTVIFGSSSEIVRRSRATTARSFECLALAYTWADDKNRSVELLQLASVIAHETQVEARIEAQLQSLREQLDDEETLQHSYLANEVFQVILPGTSYTVPQLCACCLGDPNTTISVSYSWEEYHIFSKSQRSVTFSFPYCKDCKKHSGEFENKRLFVILASSISTMLTGILFKTMMTEGDYIWIIWLVFVLACCSGWTFLWCCLIKLRPLGSHCSRTDAVELVFASNNVVRLKFWNKKYAERFALCNGQTASTQHGSKHTFSTSLFNGKSRHQVVIWSAILGFIGISWNSSGPTKSSTITPSTNSVPQRTKDLVPGERVPDSKTAIVLSEQAAASYENEQTRRSTMEALNQKIEAGRVKISTYEEILKKDREQIQSLKDELASSKKEVNSYEQQVSQGIEVDRPAYQAALDEHNSKVDETNTTVQNYHAVYVQYEKLIKQDKQWVRQYNALVRR